MRVPISSMATRSLPETFRPIGVRIPVVSMSMRPFTGMVQALESPGSFRASFKRATSSSREMRSGVIRRSGPLAHSGRELYQVSLLRHWEGGFRTTTVSSMESGAGSVEVSARPALPSTRSTSGKPLMIRSVTWSSFPASPMEMPGMVVGM